MGNIVPAQVSERAQALKPLGVANLLACLEKSPLDTVNRKNADQPAPEATIKRKVTVKALSLIAAAADIPALVAGYEQQPFVLAVFYDHPEWDSDSAWTTFLASSLDNIRSVYEKSDATARLLILLVARSPNPDVQTKLDGLTSNATTNDGAYPNAHLFADLVYSGLSYPKSSIAKHWPDLFVVLVNRAQTQSEDPYNSITPLEALGQGILSTKVTEDPGILADAKTKDAVIKLSQALVSNGVGSPTVGLIPAAAAGDKSSLSALAALCRDASPSTKAQQDAARRYLLTVSYAGQGDKLTQVLSHIDTANYDPATCRWTVEPGQ